MVTYLESTGKCTHCDKQVVIKKRAINHILHLLLIIPTFGLWLLVWIDQGMRNTHKKWSCSQCGLPVVKLLSDKD